MRANLTCTLTSARAAESGCRLGELARVPEQTSAHGRERNRRRRRRACERQRRANAGQQVRSCTEANRADDAPTAAACLRRAARAPDQSNVCALGFGARARADQRRRRFASVCPALRALSPPTLFARPLVLYARHFFLSFPKVALDNESGLATITPAAEAARHKQTV